MVENKDRYIVPAVKQAVQILEYLAESATTPVSLLSICNDLGIHKSKAYSILYTLQQSELVRKLENKGGYSLGPGLVPMSKRFLDNLDSRSLARPILDKLANQFLCAAAFGIIENDYVYAIAEKAESKHRMSIVASSVGQRFPVDMGAHGVAIASTLSEDQLNKFMGMDSAPFMGEFARFEDELFLEKVESCRENGYVYDIGYIRSGLNSVASPVVNSSQRAVGYIIVFGLFEEAEIEDIGKRTLEGAKELSRQLG